MEERFQLPAVVRENASTGTNQVRVGEFTEKEEAQSTLRRLNESGYPDAFLVRDEIPGKGNKIALTLRGPQDLFRVAQTGFLIQPSSREAFLSVDGKPYRGFLDVYLNKNGRITVVNELGTEEYLQGVVPAEISPTTYPEFAALAAQAIAARTYARRNMGRFRSEGFDLTNDTRTQVYGGVAMEKEATDLAVRQTSGLAIYYKNKLIDAMYMSTCGGRTEDFANVFDAPEVPYLKSVFCAIESGPERGATLLEGRHSLDQSLLSDDGSIANRNLELARVAGLIEYESEISQDYFNRPAQRKEIVRWVDKAGKLARKEQPDDPRTPEDVETRAGFLQYAANPFLDPEKSGANSPPGIWIITSAISRMGTRCLRPPAMRCRILCSPGCGVPIPTTGSARTLRSGAPTRCFCFSAGSNPPGRTFCKKAPLSRPKHPAAKMRTASRSKSKSGTVHRNIASPKDCLCSEKTRDERLP
jgi:SpoIID/LytB domain protein